jgi:hypothetical protein
MSRCQITPVLHAGLGNQMFMIANAYAVSKENEGELILNDIYFGSRKSYFDTLFLNFSIKIIDLEQFETYQEKSFEYREIPKFEEKSKIKLVGYFQSEKYFEKYSKEIRQLFQLPISLNNFASNFFKNEQNVVNRARVCVHIRRGDYLKSNILLVQSIEYYVKSINKMKNLINSVDVSYVFFSDDKKFVDENFKLHDQDILINNLQDYEEFAIMQMCDHFIISNSTFSWWAAWLSQRNENKKVICPFKWFTDQKIYHHDIYPKNWTIL